MKTSKQARQQAKQLFRGCIVNGVLDEDRVRQVVRQLIAGKPRGYLRILSHYRRLVRLDLAQRTARVECAVPLASWLQASVRQNLERIHRPGLTVSFVLNPALIGGLRIQVGSDVYDGSIRARLAALQASF
jgi:F-type H+-transporting ATPase subunit delta